MNKSILALLILLIVTASQAAFKDIGWSVRASGMGKAFAAVADDSSGLLVNPAGISKLEYRETSLMYSQLFTGLEDVNIKLNSFTYVQPAGKLGAFGVAWTSFDTNSIYRETMYSLSYADAFNGLLGSWRNLYLGLNIKYLEHSYTLDRYSQDDPVFANGVSKGNFTVDLGSIFEPQFESCPGLSFGLALRNVTQPDIGLATSDIVPFEGQAGAAYFFTGGSKLQDITFALDLLYRNQEWGSLSDKLTACLGAETWVFRKMLGLRAGVNSREASVGASFQSAVIGDFGLRFDYAFNFPFYLPDTTGTHRASLSVRF